MPSPASSTESSTSPASPSRVRTTTRRAAGGQAHGGRLWAESEPGRGATPRCALPAWGDRGGL